MRLWFRERRGTLIPYVEIDLPLESFRELWLGPRIGDQLDESALRLFLSKHKIDVEIHRSRASYRAR
jgi:hypothetical protein